ncbi:DUF6879 family protein [Kribbella sp. NPDC056951]|uniref:DUF6879 family protein n=1 Tax=Kribbella sp. NPDC056951 TaxID=3345978 RepID=UPI00362A74E5
MIKSLDVTTLRELYWSAKRAVFRIELLQSYDWPDEADRIAEWRATGSVTPSTDPQWQETADQISDGCTNTLLHVIDLPLNDYLRYEFAAYQANNLATGQDVRIALRSSHPGLAEIPSEFALFDDTLVWYRYNMETGVKLGWELDDDPATLAQCQHYRDLAVANSVPLLQFIDDTKDDPHQT